MDARHNMHRTDSCAEGGFAKASARFGVVTAQGVDGAQRRDRRRMG